MNPINFNGLSPSNILKKDKYYFLEYCNKGWSKRKLLTKFIDITPIQELEFSDLYRFTDDKIECLHFTNTTDVRTRTGEPFCKYQYNKDIKLYYLNNKLYAREEFRWIYSILTGWNWASVENYRIDECLLYTPMKEEIVLKKILNDPHFTWNN